MDLIDIGYTYKRYYKYAVLGLIFLILRYTFSEFGLTLGDYYEGVYWRNFIIGVFIKAGLSEEEAKSMAEYFIDIRDRLHGACFYGMIYEELEHRPLMEKARNYLDLVKSLLRVDEST